MQIYFHSCLWSYLPRVPILVEDTVYKKISLTVTEKIKVKISNIITVFNSITVFDCIFD